MIKSLQDAKITDLLPRIVAEQVWVKALAEALSIVHQITMDYAKNSQIYTAIDTAPETVLDALAVNWKIDWYDTDYPIDKKRRMVKTALDVRRLMGTTYAARMQADAIYPGTKLEEWFDYNGEPGCFRLFVDITGTSEEDPAVVYDMAEMEHRLTAAKRWSTQLDNLSYVVLHKIVLKKKVEAWAHTPPFCGAIYCGTWWTPATMGHSERARLLHPAGVGGYAYQPDFTGTLPERATEGYSVCGAVNCGAVTAAFVSASGFSGEIRCGTLP
jgi:phage tail P2-like protein